MLLVHITLTPLAGAPISLVKALNKHSDFEARLINFNPKHYGKRSFAEDLSWKKDKKECLELIKNADIIHFHHYFDFASENNQFGINFKNITKKEALFLRTYHSHPITYKDVVDFNDIPSTVIPHNASRYYPKSKILPNIIPNEDELYLPLKKNNKKPLVVFSPSVKYSAFAGRPSRWDTKSYPEVLKIVKQAQKVIDFDFKVITNTPHQECLKIKQQADIVIDDIASGSMHLSALEGLSQGAVVLSYLDNTVYNNFLNLTEAKELPVVNVRLNEMKQALIELVKNKKLRDDLSKYSRHWIENYYSEEKMVQHYLNAYNELLETGTLKVNTDFSLAKDFIRKQVPEISWQELEKRYWFKSYFYKLIKKAISGVKSNKILFKLAKRVKKCIFKG